MPSLAVGKKEYSFPESSFLLNEIALLATALDRLAQSRCSLSSPDLAITLSLLLAQVGCQSRYTAMLLQQTASSCM
jgi:hypothetical protein